MFNKDITVINRYIDKNRKPQYKVSHIKGFWSSEDGIVINGTHIKKSDDYYAMILMSEQDYQIPKEFEKEQKGWTLKNNDYLVKGIVDNFISITNLLEEYEEGMKITKISTADYGSDNMKHWEITGG